MCGIAAVFSYRDNGFPVDHGELLRMRDHMITRGPDGAGVWLDPKARIGLAHRRLAILDLTENGAQPMGTPDGQFRIVFNGEIYNYRELRDQLKAKGCVFCSGTDTEVLLYAYREYGLNMVDHLRGMFAFAIWDETKRGLYLARDHFGLETAHFIITMMARRSALHPESRPFWREFYLRATARFGWTRRLGEDDIVRFEHNYGRSQ